MATLKKNIILIVFSFIGMGCALLDSGYINEHQQYVPKRPKFKLKDKKGGVLTSIDTLSIYRRVEMYNDGKLVYPLPKEEATGWAIEANRVRVYIKFYKNGRCLIFSIWNDDRDPLKQEDLNPNKGSNHKSYYYSAEGKNVQTEKFIHAQGTGIYVISDYSISDSGDTLIKSDRWSTTVYKKEAIPMEWHSKYKVDW